jgi:tRNA threonylcarbamoyladenosine biosynthesis protein TsaB
MNQNQPNRNAVNMADAADLTLLAVETSTEACSAALYFKGQYFEVFELQPQKHAHRILAMVDEVLTQAGIKGSQVDYLAFGEGPGAFTGTRIAAGVIQGLALGWQKPVIGISSLEAMAEATVKTLAAEQAQQIATSDSPIEWCALMDARMQEVYCLMGQYHPRTQRWHVQDAQLLTPECAQQCIDEKTAQLASTQLANIQLANTQAALHGIGDIKTAYPGLVNGFKSWHDALPSALSVVRLAQATLQDSACRSALQTHKLPVPVYLRNHVADTLAERAQKQADIRADQETA